MDPKKLAEEILNQLFPQQEELVEEQETEEEEEEGEEEEGEEEENNNESEQEGKTPLAKTLDMKSSAPAGSTSGKGTFDASGKGVQPFPGVGQPQEF